MNRVNARFFMGANTQGDAANFYDVKSKRL